MTPFCAVQRRIDSTLRFAETTRCVRIGENLLDRTGEVFRESFGADCPAILVADRNTMKAAGTEILNRLRGEEITTLEEPFVFAEPNLHAERKHCDRLRERFSHTEAIPIAVGSGTINDLVKLAAFESGRKYMIVATAASMDGYAAYGAPIESGGFKKTVFCDAPTAILIDMDVICRAPGPLAAAGYADLIAKVPAGADWILADFVGAEPIHFVAFSLVQNHLSDWIADPEGVARQEKSAILNLLEGLITSGIAMQLAKTSRTASGAEHLFSHLWDNQGHTFGGEIPYHGFKVGIGTIATESLYEQALKLESNDFRDSKRAILQNRRTWEQTERFIRDSFSGEEQIGRVIEESRAKYVSDDEIVRRLDLFAGSWEEVKRRLQKQLLGPQTIRRNLQIAGAPSQPEQIGIDRTRFLESFALAQLIRSRYTILDFLQETGMWDVRVFPISASLPMPVRYTR